MNPARALLSSSTHTHCSFHHSLCRREKHISHHRGWRRGYTPGCVDDGIFTFFSIVNHLSFYKKKCLSNFLVALNEDSFLFLEKGPVNKGYFGCSLLVEQVLQAVNNQDKFKTKS